MWKPSEADILEAEKTFGAEIEIAETLGAETPETVGNGWEYGVYIETRKNGETMIMRRSPFAGRKISESEFDRETGENRAVASESGCTFRGKDSTENPFYFGLYSEPEESVNDTCPDHGASARDYAANELNRETADRLSRERMITRTIERAERAGIALSAEAIAEIESRVSALPC